MSVTVYLANKGFTLPVGRLDDARRKAHFANPADPKNKLLPEEIEILTSLGINETEAKPLYPYLAEFFQMLPECQSDASVILSKECETIHHVLWTILFNARNRSKTAYNLNKATKKPLADLSVAINNSVLKDLQPKREDINDTDRLFTLLLKTPDIPVTVTADRLFTLIFTNPSLIQDEEPQPGKPSPPGSVVDTEPSVISSTGSTSSKLSMMKRLMRKTPFTKGSTQVSDIGPDDMTELPTGPQDIPTGDATIHEELPSHDGETKKVPSRPWQFTRKVGKSLFGKKGTQINLGGPNNEIKGENPMIKKQSSINRPGESPFTKRSTEIPLGGPEVETPSNNHQGESPFTKTRTNIDIGRTPGKLTVIPDTEDIRTQCDGRDVPRNSNGQPFREKHEGEFNRSCYFFYSIKYQEPIELTSTGLPSATQTKFIADWQKALKGHSKLLDPSLKFLGVSRKDLDELNTLYQVYINGGVDSRPHPILAYDCGVLGERAAGLLERFAPVILKTPKERTYQFEHADWPAGGGSMIDSSTPHIVNDISIAFRDKEQFNHYYDSDIKQLTIITTHDINYSEADVFNYEVQGSHIHELTLAQDIFPKNKSYILDISPRLMYLFNKERDIQRPTSAGTRSISTQFLDNAFQNNYIPPLLSPNDAQVQEQINVAFYEICYAITSDKSNPSSFYSKPFAEKLPKIIKWLGSDADYKPIIDAMNWAVFTKEAIPRSALLDIFKVVEKKPTSFFKTMFTLKKKKNFNTTRKNWTKNEAMEVKELQKQTQNKIIKNAQQELNKMRQESYNSDKKNKEDDKTITVEEPPKPKRTLLKKFGNLFTKKQAKITSLPNRTNNINYYDNKESPPNHVDSALSLLEKQQETQGKASRALIPSNTFKKEKEEELNKFINKVEKTIIPEQEALIQKNRELLDKTLKKYKNEKNPDIKTFAKQSALSILRSNKLAEKILDIYKSLLTKVKKGQQNRKEPHKIAENIEGAMLEIKTVTEEEPANSTLPDIEEDNTLSLFEQQRESQASRPLIPKGQNGPKA